MREDPLMVLAWIWYTSILVLPPLGASLFVRWGGRRYGWSRPWRAALVMEAIMGCGLLSYILDPYVQSEWVVDNPIRIQMVNRAADDCVARAMSVQVGSSAEDLQGALLAPYWLGDDSSSGCTTHVPDNGHQILVETDSGERPPNLNGHSVWLTCSRLDPHDGLCGTTDDFGFVISSDGVVSQICHDTSVGCE